jgi:hypothetical protein
MAANLQSGIDRCTLILPSDIPEQPRVQLESLRSSNGRSIDSYIGYAGARPCDKRSRNSPAGWLGAFEFILAPRRHGVTWLPCRQLLETPRRRKSPQTAFAEITLPPAPPDPALPPTGLLGPLVVRRRFINSNRATRRGHRTGALEISGRRDRHAQDSSPRRSANSKPVPIRKPCLCASDRSASCSSRIRAVAALKIRKLPLHPSWNEPEQEKSAANWDPAGPSFGHRQNGRRSGSGCVCVTGKYGAQENMEPSSFCERPRYDRTGLPFIAR